MTSYLYSPSGALLGRPAAVARMLGVSRQVVYRAADEAPGGYRLPYVPQADGRRTPHTRIVLWDGRPALGWREAARLTGESQGALKMRRVRRADGWYVRRAYK